MALDLACGTGDVCFLLAERFSNAGIEGLDLTREMLDIAERRNQFGDRVNFVQGDICNLPQASDSKDLITGSYAWRNAPDLLKMLQEIHRVLKPGGVVAFLDFSKSPSAACEKNTVCPAPVLGRVMGSAFTRQSRSAWLHCCKPAHLPLPTAT